MTEQDNSRATLGLHDSLVITKIPAGAQSSLVGTPLAQAGALAIAGAYECEFRCDGLSKLEVRLTATFASGTGTSSGGSLFANRSTTVTTWTGAAALTSTVEQTLTIAALKGEKYAKVIMTTTGTVISFTKAEVFGPRI